MASRPTFLWPIDERAAQERASLPFAAAQERALHPPPTLPGFTASTHYIPAASPRSSAGTLRADGFTSDATRFGEEEYARARQLTAESKVKDAAALLPFWIPPAEGHAGGSGKATSGADHEAARTLSLTCYTPEHAAEDAPVALFVHATGTTKESFIPLINSLLSCGLEFREIWLVDYLSHGATELENRARRPSGDHGLNEHDRIVNHNDLARDLLQFLLHFLPLRSERAAALPFHPAAEAPRSRGILGIGSSVGATALLAAAYERPELFRTLVLSEPILVPPQQVAASRRVPLPAFALRRQDTWKSREHARSSIDRDPMLASWTNEAKDLYVQYALRPVEDNDGSKDVTLICDKVIEALSLSSCIPAIQLPSQLQHLSPDLPILYVSCAKPLMMPLKMIQKMIDPAPNCQLETVQGGHHLPQDNPQGLADQIVRFLGKQGIAAKL